MSSLFYCWIWCSSILHRNNTVFLWIFFVFLSKLREKWVQLPFLDKKTSTQDSSFLWNKINISLIFPLKNIFCACFGFSSAYPKGCQWEWCFIGMIIIPAERPVKEISSRYFDRRCRPASQNSIAPGNGILARCCERSEQ